MGIRFKTQGYQDGWFLYFQANAVAAKLHDVNLDDATQRLGRTDKQPMFSAVEIFIVATNNDNNGDWAAIFVNS